MMITHTQCLLCLVLVVLSNSAMIEPSTNFPVQVVMGQQQYLITLFNQDRAKRSLGEIYLDDNLSEIAQAHTDYMIQETHFSHYTLDGKDPSDRARQANFSYVVRQVIEKGDHILGVHRNLIGNPLNLNIILNTQNTRAGVGIGMLKNGAMIVTVVFSTRDFENYPYSKEEIKIIHDYVSKYISTRDKYAKEEDVNLTKAVQEWIEGDREVDGVDYLLQNKFFKKGRITLLPTYMSIFPNTPSLADSIGYTNISYLIKNRMQFRHFGIAVGAITGGRVEIWVFYTS